MKINKSDIKDGATFLFVATIFFLIAMDIAFPFVMCVMKAIFYLVGSFMLALGIGTIVRSIFGRKRNDEILTESKEK